MKTELPDDQNPRYLYSCTHSDLLVQIVKAEISPVTLAKMELCNRGVGLDGRWIGFMEAEKLHFPDGRPQDTDQ